VATLEASALVRPPKVDGTPFIPQDARVVEKPWGAEYIWAETERYAGKLLFVRAGHSLSLQYHERKMESMWVLAGAGTLEIDGQPRAISPGSTVTILPGTLHRLTAQVDLSVLEVSTPELDDVIRVQDVYGRA
jgi:mannose-1-phosphate guanylyltransferase